MIRLDEKAMADKFVQKLENGFYSRRQSPNAGTGDYIDRERRDTSAVKDFVKSKLFTVLENTTA